MVVIICLPSFLGLSGSPEVRLVDYCSYSEVNVSPQSDADMMRDWLSRENAVNVQVGVLMP
jgi:hypothetical protein